MFRRNKKLTGSPVELHAPDGIEPIDLSELQSETTALTTVARLFDVYQPGVVFSEPHTVGDQTVITASEVHVGMGVGFGHGADDEDNRGGGGGGGGGSAGRPVAAIVISPKGVQVEPIVDVTKIALAFFTTIGALFMAWRAMRRQR